MAVGGTPLEAGLSTHFALFDTSMLHSSISRLLTVFFILLALGMVVLGAPLEAGKDLVVARGSPCVVGCTTGTDTMNILTRLQDDLEPKLKALDGYLYDHFTVGTDPSGIIANIVALINDSVVLIHELDKDAPDLNNGKNYEIATLFLNIVSGIAEHFTEGSSKTAALGDIIANFLIK
ncbi:hypothetical protein FRC11_002256 [Ceratobasidium sp. 423]|nr:hypothetical protein FRC11_002256 [Ceratobasidium sp. 423]